jgi:hypothetical protein
MEEIDVEKMSDEQRFELAGKYADNVRNALTVALRRSDYRSNAEMLFRAGCYREVLIHRFSDLADVALQLLASRTMVPAFVVVRAVLETTAVMFQFRQKSEAFLNSGDVDAYEAFIKKGLLGSRDGSTEEESQNILTIIRHCEKKFSGIEAMYARLCEYTHPNFAGVLGSYATVDKRSWTLHLGKTLNPPHLVIGLAPLMGCLDIFTEYYNSAGEVITKIDSQLESQTEQRDH